MVKTLSTAILAAGWLLMVASAAEAQFWPGYGYDGGYGAWGAYAAGMENATTRNIAQQDRLAGQLAANQQMAAMQNNIRNTLNTQAEMRTQMINSQQQSNSDWWFGVQQQQLAQRQAMSRGSASASAAAAAAQAVEQIPTAPQAQTDIIAWPPVLCDARFAEQRAMVEAPYRRVPKGQAKPTVEDYQNMIKAVDQMKILLNEMTSEVSAQVYLHAEKFLDQLATEARGRIGQTKP
jgi:hypothetical protein